MSKQTVEVSKKFKVKQPNGTFKQVYIATDANKVFVNKDKNLNTYLDDLSSDMEALSSDMEALSNTIGEALIEEKDVRALADSRNAIKPHNIVFPIYMGHDYIPNFYQSSAFFKNGDIVYILNNLPNAENGQVTRYDIKDNKVLAPFSGTTPMSHANSVATDGDYVYVLRNRNANVSKTVATTFYRYTINDFVSNNPPTQISFGGNEQPKRIMSVSYDWKKKQLYFLDDEHGVWIRENETWVKYSTIYNGWTKLPTWSDEQGEFNQDFAIYDGCFYISSPKRMVVSGILQPDISYITDSFILASETADHLYYLGENQGWEFTSDGHLMMVDIIGVSYASRCVFYLQVPTSHSLTMFSRAMRTDIEGTLWDGIMNHCNRFRVNISKSIQEQFAVNGKQIKSLNDVYVRKMGKPTNVTVLAGDAETTDVITQPYDVIIQKPFSLEFQNYTKLVLKSKIRVRDDFHILTSPHCQLQVSHFDYNTITNTFVDPTTTGGGQIFSLESGSLTIDSMGGDFPQNNVDPQYPLYVKGPNIQQAYSLVYTSFGEPTISVEKEPYFWDYTGNGSYKLLSTFSNRSLIRGYSSSSVPSFGYPCVIRRGKQFLSTSTLSGLAKTGTLTEVDECPIDANVSFINKDGLGNIELYCKITISNDKVKWAVIGHLPNDFCPQKTLRTVGTLEYGGNITPIPVAINQTGSNNNGIQVGLAVSTGSVIHIHAFYR